MRRENAKGRPSPRPVKGGASWRSRSPRVCSSLHTVCGRPHNDLVHEVPCMKCGLRLRLHLEQRCQLPSFRPATSCPREGRSRWQSAIEATMRNRKTSGARPGKPAGSRRLSAEAGGSPTSDGQREGGSTEKKVGPRARRAKRQRGTVVAERGRARQGPRRSSKTRAHKRPQRRGGVNRRQGSPA